MRTTYFAADAQRRISAAYYNTYVSGLLHPDRIMTEHDFIFMCEGEWEIWQDDAPHMLTAGNALVLSAGAHHMSLRPCSAGTKTMFIHVNDCDDAKNEPGRVPLAPLTDCAGYPNVRQIFRTIVEVFSSDAAYREARLSALMQLLITELYDAQNGARATRRGDIVGRATSLIRENSQLFYTERELAAAIFVSPKTLVGRFLSELGVTPYRYQNDYKLDSAAAFLIAQPRARLREVAENFGFCDEFHLSKAFKRRFGVSPSEYRAAGRKI